MTLTKGDLTWFSPNWFQTHQLENATGEFCCTVQGFQYADDDDVHWPYMQFKVRFDDARRAVVAHAAVTAQEMFAIEQDVVLQPSTNLGVRLALVPC
jgi:hypothetical protein